MHSVMICPQRYVENRTTSRHLDVEPYTTDSPGELHIGGRYDAFLHRDLRDSYPFSRGFSEVPRKYCQAAPVLQFVCAIPVWPGREVGGTSSHSHVREYQMDDVNIT